MHWCATVLYMYNSMTLKIDIHSSHPIYAQIVEQIKHQILIGQIKAGEGLSSVRSLANDLEINSLTIQKAYKQLEAEGLVEIRKGVGVFVAEQLEVISMQERKNQALQLLTPALERSLSILKNKKNLNKLIENIMEDLDDHL